MTSTALAQRADASRSAMDELWNAEQKKSIRELLVPPSRDGRIQVRDADLALFGEVCKRTGLDPFTRQIYLLPTGQGIKIHIGVDGLRAIAHRTGDAISIETFWKAKGGEWSDAWEGEGEPFAALCVVRRGQSTHRAVVHMSEFRGLSPNWKEKPAHQLGIVAERHALRKACPFELAGTVRQAQSVSGVSVAVSDDEPEPAQFIEAGAQEPTYDDATGEREMTRNEALAEWLEGHEQALALKIPHVPPKRTATIGEIVDLTEHLRQALSQAGIPAQPQRQERRQEGLV